VRDLRKLPSLGEGKVKKKKKGAPQPMRPFGHIGEGEETTEGGRGGEEVAAFPHRFLRLGKGNRRGWRLPSLSAEGEDKRRPLRRKKGAQERSAISLSSPPARKKKAERGRVQIICLLSSSSYTVKRGKKSMKEESNHQGRTSFWPFEQGKQRGKQAGEKWVVGYTSFLLLATKKKKEGRKRKRGEERWM